MKFAFKAPSHTRCDLREKWRAEKRWNCVETLVLLVLTIPRADWRVLARNYAVHQCIEPSEDNLCMGIRLAASLRLK